MSTVATRAPSLRRAAPGASSRFRRTLAALAGPVLILVSVIVAMRGFVFGDLLTNQHPDILAQWLPRFCFLGRNLLDGHLPLWNPLQFAGVPYASDAQSGWLYGPVMALTTALPCGMALRAFIVLQPMLAGLGLYWFLRKEGLHRVAATAGGLSLAIAIGGSNVAVSLPFAGFLAWTPMVLVGASGYLRQTQWWRRLLWLALAALAWGQVAAAHMSHGLLMSTLIVSIYLVARSVREVRRKEMGWARAAVLVLGFLAFLPLANAAIFVPRLALVPGTSLRGGYAALGVKLAKAAGINEPPLPHSGVWSGWPLALGSTPGAYAGASILLAIPLAIRTRDKRHLAIAFAVCGLVAYVLTLNALVGSSWFPNLVLRLPFGDVYLHNPGRLRYLAYLIAPVLGALGIQSLIERPLPWRRCALWLVPAVGVFLVLPLALGAHLSRLQLLAVGMAVGIPTLLALGRWKRWAFIAVPAVLAAQLLGGAFWSQAYQGGTIFFGLEPNPPTNLVAGPLRWPDVPVDGYLTPGPIAHRLQEHRGRYLTWAPPAAYFEKGYLFTQKERYWPALENGRGMLFGIEDAIGYSPIQLARYWSYIRATNRLPLAYNAAVLPRPTLEDVRLLGVRYLIVPSNIAPIVPARPVQSEGGYTLYEVYGWQPRASVVTSWTVVPDATNALVRVLERGFNPAQTAVVERDPGIEQRPGAPRGTATYAEASPEDVQVGVDAAAPALVVVRNSFDGNWSATVDGKPAPVLIADYFLQAVPVPSGHHEVRLVYRDPWIARGLAASGVVWALWLLGLLTAGLLRRRRGRASR